MSESAEVLYALNGVTRVFRGSLAPTYALRDASIEIRKGEFVAIMGSSGAGKSTLLNVLGLLDTPSSGTLRVLGTDISTLRESELDQLRAQTIGFVFQSSDVLAEETVEYNAALAARLRFSDQRVLKERVFDALATVGLSHRIGALARTLSGGERQRLAIARSIAAEPEVILADEPTGNLDSKNSDSIMELFSKLHRLGTTIVMITHDPSTAEHAERVVRMSDGILDDPSRADSEARNQQDVARSTHGSKPRRRRRRGHSRQVWLALCQGLTALTARPARTLAMLTAIAVGVAGLVAAQGVASSASQQIADRLDNASLSEFTVYNNQATDTNELQLRESQIRELEHVQAVGLAIPLSGAQVQLTRADGELIPFEGRVRGVNSGYFEAAQIPLETGLSELFDTESNRGVALLGPEAASRVGSSAVGGQTIWVAGRPFDVIGVLPESDDPVLESSIFLSFSGLAQHASEFLVRTDIGFSLAVSEAVPYALNPGNPGSISVTTVGDLRNLRQGVSTDLDTLLAVTGLILLALATITAAAVMTISVQSRTREIALRRAVGYRRSSVAFSFLAEGALLGLGGGLAGLAIGLVGVILNATLQNWSAIVPAGALIAAPLIGIVAGAVASVIPAIRSASIPPALAIRD